LATLDIFAQQAAVAIVNAERFTRTDQALSSRMQELNTLHIIDRELNASLDLEMVLDLTLSRTMDAFGAPVGVIGLVDHERTGINFKSMIGVANKYERYRTQIWPLDRGIIGRVVSTGQPICATNGDLDNFAGDGRSTSQLCVPIQRDEEVIGVISMELADEEPFNDKDQEFATRLASHAALALQNASLFEQVKSANQAKTEFMSVASHELKIPMTSIKGYAKLLEMTAGAALNDQQKEFLRIIGSNIDRMNRLVSDLLDVSRIEAGRLQLELEEVSIRDVVDEVVQSVETQIQKKELNLAIDIPPAIPKVWADHGRMVQVMTNLISNAYKYTPGGGRIAVGAQERGSRNNGRHISIYVTDTGLGIAEAEQEQLFNKFFRADNPAVREEPGTGLGLAITKSLIEMHGGTMWFESELGKGSTFGFDLPLNTKTALAPDDTIEESA
jgi:signal transduction histidine kinase